MDPQKSQSDPADDAHSLEGADTVMENDAGTPNTSSSSSDTPLEVDATNGATNSDSTPPKTSFVKRIWQKFNIYLLLFILVVLIAIAITVGLYVKNRNAASTVGKEVISNQDLSTEALKQIANTNISVGKADQVLNVKSNAIFTGAVLAQSDLEVAGSIKVGGGLQLPNITVNGTGRFSQVQTDTLAVGNNAAVQGSLTVQKGITVTGNGSFTGSLSAAQITTGSLQLNSDLTLTRHIVAGGPIPGVSRGNALGAGGTVSIGGSDTAGSLTVNTGSGTGAGCFATITFTTKFANTPRIVITPVGSAAATVEYYVNRSTGEFSICTTNPAPTGQTFGFDYFVVS